MHASVRTLLTGIIDYAGLFPPAKLPLDEALVNYLRFKKESPYAWMLGRFVCPAARLPDLMTLAKGHPNAPILSLTVLGTQSSSGSTFATQTRADLRAIHDFRRTWIDSGVIDMYEVPLPDGASVAQNSALMAELAKSNLRVFFEVPLASGWESRLNSTAADCKTAAEELDEACPDLGLKLRCGGVTAQAFPSNEQVAHFINLCRRHLLPWKATAGLHHPRRHWDSSLNLRHHGFLNVFGTGVLAVAHGLSPSEIACILADEIGTHFHFADSSFGWKHWICSIDEIEAGRELATSFGSCSFEEPVADLVAMGLLDRA